MDHVSIANVFNQCFTPSHSTRMLGGADEPLYLPIGLSGEAELHYREDFAASALHEAAHWCIAGARRRGLSDFGYVYIAPPRTPAQQHRFLACEVHAQALESVFAKAANVPFVLSTDEIGPMNETVVGRFDRCVAAARIGVSKALSARPDARAARFARALAAAADAAQDSISSCVQLGANGQG